MTGLVGRMFREFALTLTIAVVTSAVVSLTLTPMMCSRLLRHQSEGAPGRGLAPLFITRSTGPVEVYRRSLEWVLRHETLTLLVTAGTLVATVWLYIIIPKGFLPLQDTGLIFAVMEGGQEVSFTEMQRLQAEVEERDPQGSRRDRRGLGDRRDADQRHAECRAGSPSRCARATCARRR